MLGPGRSGAGWSPSQANPERSPVPRPTRCLARAMGVVKRALHANRASVPHLTGRDGSTGWGSARVPPFVPNIFAGALLTVPTAGLHRRPKPKLKGNFRLSSGAPWRLKMTLRPRHDRVLVRRID